MVMAAVSLRHCPSLSPETKLDQEKPNDVMSQPRRDSRRPTLVGERLVRRLVRRSWRRKLPQFEGLLLACLL